MSHIRTRRSHLDHCKCRTRRAHHAVIHVVADAIRIDVFSAIATANAQSIFLVSVTVTVAFRNVRTSALVDVSCAVAYAARVEHTHAVINIVADAVRIVVSRAITAANAQSVFLVSVAIAVAFRDVSTPALVDVPCAVAHAARVERTHAIVHVVADAIRIVVSRAIAAANAEGVERFPSQSQLPSGISAHPHS